MKVGDRVRVRDWKLLADDEYFNQRTNGMDKSMRWYYDKYRPDHWNNIGRMDHWCGREVTIEYMQGIRVGIKEDKEERRGHGWSWRETDFEDLNSKVDLLDEDLFEL